MAKMTVRDTSITTYKDLINEDKLSDRQLDVIHALEILEIATDSEITSFWGYSDPNIIRPRRKELLDLGIICEAGKKVCTKTGRLAYLWCLNQGDIVKHQKRNHLTDSELKKIFSLIQSANLFQLNKIHDQLKNVIAERSE